MNSPLLSILTVNFGSSHRIQHLWKSLQAFPPSVSWEWIIVDNPTKKGGDGERLAAFFKKEARVHVIQLAKNLGYGGGNAEGFRFCRGEILAILNPDTLVQKGTLDILLASLKSEKKAGIVVPILTTHDGKILENARKFPSFVGLIKRRLFGSQILSSVPRGKAREIEWAQGSFWVLRRSLFEQLSGFDPRFFLFLEDTDFCRRVWKAGFRVLQVPMAVAGHSPNRLSGGNIFSAIFRKTFWIHLTSAVKYFAKWGRETMRLD
jgi:GT2 family glycosyltransferase